MNSKNNNARFIIGLLLIVIGGLILLDKYDYLNISIPSFVFSWQVILIAIGLILFFTSRNKTAGSILIFIGGLALLPEFWPVILIAIGLLVLLKQTKAGNKISHSFHSNLANDADGLDEVFIFSGGTKIIQSNNFIGGKITSIFGGGEIDLLDAKLSPGENVIDITAIFGGVTIIVPKEWKIQVAVTPLLGGFADSRTRDPQIVQDTSKTLKITGTAIFGGGELKN